MIGPAHTAFGHVGGGAAFGWIDDVAREQAAAPTRQIGGLGRGQQLIQDRQRQRQARQIGMQAGDRKRQPVQPVRLGRKQGLDVDRLRTGRAKGGKRVHTRVFRPGAPLVQRLCAN